MGYYTIQCEVVSQKRKSVVQSIGEAIDEEQDWAQHTALWNSSLHWEMGGEGSIDGNTLTASGGLVRFVHERRSIVANVDFGMNSIKKKSHPIGMLFDI